MTITRPAHAPGEALVTTSVQHCVEVLAKAIGQENEIKDSQMGKGEVKLSQFADDTISYKGNPTESIFKAIRIPKQSKLG